MSNEIINVLNALTEKFGIAIDWTSKNIFLYLEQLINKYVKYEIVTSTIWIVLNSILCIGIIMFLFFFTKNKKFGVIECQSGYKNNEPRFWIYILCLVIIYITILVIVIQIIDIATCLTLPEKMILKELKNIYINMNK